METYPRLLVPREWYIDEEVCLGEILYLKGNAASSDTRKSPTVILQVCNVLGSYGAGFSGEIEREYPGVRKDYKTWVLNSNKIFGKPFTMGRCQALEVIPCDAGDSYPIVVCNMIAQTGTRKRKSDPCVLDYVALEKCLAWIARRFVDEFNGTKFTWRIQMPRIGCGLAGGQWAMVEPLIISTICAAGACPIVYDL